MIVYACFEFYFDGCEEFVSLIKIVADEKRLFSGKKNFLLAILIGGETTKN